MDRPIGRVGRWPAPMGALVFAALIVSPLAAHADDALPVRVGVLLPYFTQPGGRVTGFYEMPMGSAEAPAKRGDWQSNLIVGPELGLWVRPAAHRSVLAGAVFGYRLRSPTRRFTYDIALGAAYLAESQIASVDVDLATGETTDNRVLMHHLLPTVHCAFGLELLERWGWYLDLAVGQTVSADAPSALYFAVETGVQVRFDLFDGGAP